MSASTAVKPSKPINEWSALEITAAIRSGRTTCEAVTRACLERIDEREPKVGAWAFIDADLAIAQARALDRGSASGPLIGVPFGVKDIIDTFDMPTACGSPIYEGHRPQRDASCVALGRKAGGVVMGKTVTAEFAVNFPGKTRHPLDAARTPGGSSSGSAAAVADLHVPLALATQTTGSTIKPGSFCGVFAYRPTFGDVRCSGVMESSGSCDAVGFYARSVEDIALHRDVLVGIDPEPLPEDASPPRIGFVRPPQWSKLEPYTQALLEDAARRLASAGAKVSDAAMPPEFEHAEATHRAISCREFVLNFTREIEHHWDALSEDLRNGKIRIGREVTFERYREAQVLAQRCRAGLASMFADYDVLLAPS
ncbi:MAG: Aspartyl-tRNA(Asn) amidotransferase subunit Glutamyl-tRNA(Gln) amidotransferase subunit, partial [Betaproteobacteria bacterium]|nr:Aspartyl-tRNA(Asn) amidotransferase subunit Glutamyl-tRNA(Gln) amidotransferase subunit [Betaproteobacteria bacterium]